MKYYINYDNKITEPSINMDLSKFNSDEYQIMTNKKFDSKLDCYGHYLEFNKDKFNDIEKLRIFSKNVSEFLIKVTDETKYSNEDIYKNLENCLYNRKACVFSLGYNINEHKDRFHEFKNILNLLYVAGSHLLTFLIIF